MVRSLWLAQRKRQKRPDEESKETFSSLEDIKLWEWDFVCVCVCMCTREELLCDVNVVQNVVYIAFCPLKYLLAK